MFTPIEFCKEFASPFTSIQRGSMGRTERSGEGLGPGRPQEAAVSIILRQEAYRQLCEAELKRGAELRLVMSGRHACCQSSFVSSRVERCSSPALEVGVLLVLRLFGIKCKVSSSLSCLRALSAFPSHSFVRDIH